MIKASEKTQTKFVILLQNKQKQTLPYILIFIRHLCLSFFADSTQEQIAWEGWNYLALSCCLC